MRQGTWTSGLKYAKSKICTKTCHVNRSGINVKVVRITNYPGRSAPRRGRGDAPETARNGMQKLAEGIHTHRRTHNAFLYN